MRFSNNSIISSTAPGSTRPFSTRRDSSALMRSVGSEGGSVWECSSIADDPFVPKAQRQNSSEIEGSNPKRHTHHSRLRPSLSNNVITEWLNSSNFRIGIFAETSKSPCRLFLRHRTALAAFPGGAANGRQRAVPSGNQYDHALLLPHIVRRRRQ